MRNGQTNEVIQHYRKKLMSMFVSAFCLLHALTLLHWGLSKSIDLKCDINELDFLNF